MASSSEHALSTLLPPGSAFMLAYAIPLLLLSLTLTFAGSFLTLDRTRSFAPTYDSVPGSYKKKKSFRLPLEGGIGGVIIGYAFGLHLSTFFTVLIPAKSVSKPLSSASFLAVWLLSCLLTAGVAGRWRYAALAFSGISGGALFAIAISVLIHPSLLTRVIFVAIFTPITLLLCLLPGKFRPIGLRWAVAATGSFGVVLSIALLAGDIQAWADVWERLWLPAGITWGTGKEKGLSAAFAIFLVLGVISNIVLHRFFGECPDEKWDSYLANYSTNLPDRPGTFAPPTTFWKRFFAQKADTSKDLVFPAPDRDSKSLYSTGGSNQEELPGYDSKERPGFLRKGSSKQARSITGGRRGREVKFRPLGDLEMLSSSEDEDEFLRSPPPGGLPARPWLKQKTSIASTTTLVEEDEGKSGKDKRSKQSEAPDYSDYEDDHPKVRPHLRQPQRSGENWSPGFLKTQKRSSTSGSQAHSSSRGSQRTFVEPPVQTPTGAVPATPSLIKALDRIAVAQKDAFGPTAPSVPTSPTTAKPGLPRRDSEDIPPTSSGHWTEFWKDVKKKNAES